VEHVLDIVQTFDEQVFDGKISTCRSSNQPKRSGT